MAALPIEVRLARIRCHTTTDSFLEGAADEVYCFILEGYNDAGTKPKPGDYLFPFSKQGEWTRVVKLGDISEGDDKRPNMLLYTIQSGQAVKFEFWDKDKQNSGFEKLVHEKLGGFRLSQFDGNGQMSPIAAGGPREHRLYANTRYKEGRFILEGEGAKYEIWLSFTQK